MLAFAVVCVILAPALRQEKKSMSYKITCLAYTRRDPGVRGHLAAQARTGIMVGQRNLKPGETIMVSDSVYNTAKPVLDKFVKLGLVEVIYKDSSPHSEATELPAPPAEIVFVMPTAEATLEVVQEAAAEEAAAEEVAPEPIIAENKPAFAEPERDVPIPPLVVSKRKPRAVV